MLVWSIGLSIEDLDCKDWYDSRTGIMVGKVCLQDLNDWNNCSTSIWLRCGFREHKSG